MKLQLRLQEMGLSILYEKIGQRLRDFANSSGVEKLFRHRKKKKKQAV